MKILFVHNEYQQAGGEDAVVRAESALLRGNGHEVRLLSLSNDAVQGLGGRLRAAGRSVYSLSGRALARQTLDQFRPAVVHCHNLFPLLSPSVYDACAERGIPVVQTLHNYRALCANALFFRDGGPCEDCLGKRMQWPAVQHACYRGSRSGSAVVAASNAVHSARGAREKVQRFIALTEFARQKYVQAGFPAGRIAVKPNFVLSPEAPLAAARQGGVFVGRLAPEKGVDVMLQAWQQLPAQVPLRVLGDGPLFAAAQAQASPSVRLEGRRSSAEALQAMAEAAFLVFPSICYEGFPLALAEAFACGTPVIASRLGAMAELVEHGRTGLLFTPGSAAELAEAIRWAVEHPAAMEQMGRNARAEFEAKYTAERNYALLMEIYQRACDNSSAAARGARA